MGALAVPLARARPMKMEAAATPTSRRTTDTIGRGGYFQWQLMVALHTDGVSGVCWAMGPLEQ